MLAVLSVFLVSCGLAVAGIRNSGSAGGDGVTGELSTPETSGAEETTNPERTTGGDKGDSRRLVAAGSCDALDILVDPNHALPAGYEPRDLVYVQGFGVLTHGGDLLLRREAAVNLAELSQAAAQAGEEALVSSAYRSYGDQQEAFAHYTGIYGDWTSNVSAPPGESQHQLGTTVDFTNSEVAYELIPTFGDTSASRWLSRNAWRYGFINTYPADDAGTGRQAEPWEYRYVGKKMAAEIQESDLSLRKFLKQNGQAPCR